MPPVIAKPGLPLELHQSYTLSNQGEGDAKAPKQLMVGALGKLHLVLKNCSILKSPIED